MRRGDPGSAVTRPLWTVFVTVRQRQASVTATRITGQDDGVPRPDFLAGLARHRKLDGSIGNAQGPLYNVPCTFAVP